jgi:hypothetical protein
MGSLCNGDDNLVLAANTAGATPDNVRRIFDLCAYHQHKLDNKKRPPIE